MQPNLVNREKVRKTQRRYYLQRKLKENNINYHPRLKTVELCDNHFDDVEMMRQKVDRVMKYVKDLYKNHNYVIEKVIMKAKNVKEEMFVPSTETLMKVDDLRKQFPDVQTNIKKYTEFSVAVNIDSDDTLMAADNMSSEIHEVLKSVEKVRQILKAPYYNTGKAIDEYARTMTEPLEKAKKRVNDAIAEYKVVQAAMVRAQEEAEMKRIEALEEEKREELNKIMRIEQQINARIYGGVWITKDGEKKSSIGCLKETDCDAINELIATKIPRADSFKYYSSHFDETISNIRKRLAAHRINLHNLNGDSRLLREDAMEKIAIAKNEAGVESESIKEVIEKKIEKETKSEVKTLEKNYDNARKGVRAVLKFTIVEPAAVPKDFFTISEDKIKEFMRENNAQIREDLQNNKITLTGIKFFVDDTYCSK